MDPIETRTFELGDCATGALGLSKLVPELNSGIIAIQCPRCYFQRSDSRD